MLRLDNATPASPLLRSILSFTFDIGLCGGEILLFFEFMNIAIIVILSPTSSSCSITALIFFFCRYNKYKICRILFNRLSDVLPAYTCTSSMTNLSSICFDGNIVSPFPWVGYCKISIFTGVASGLNGSDSLGISDIFLDIFSITAV